MVTTKCKSKIAKLISGAPNHKIEVTRKHTESTLSIIFLFINLLNKFWIFLIIVIRKHNINKYFT